MTSPEGESSNLMPAHAGSPREALWMDHFYMASQHVSVTEDCFKHTFHFSAYWIAVSSFSCPFYCRASKKKTGMHDEK